MNKLKRDKQTLEELDRAKDNNLGQANEAANQQLTAQPRLTPLEELQQLVSDLHTTIRQQQLKSEQSVQQTLQQAAVILDDAQKVERMTKQVQAMQQAMAQQGPANNPQFYQQILRQLNTNIQEQLHQSDQQISQALQQTVSSLAQSQAAMFDSQAFYKMAELVKSCEKTIQQWQAPVNNSVHH